jgi:hypothetical protein
MHPTPAPFARLARLAPHAIGLALVAPFACPAAGAPAHEVQAAIPGTAWIAVAAEGEGEPRSVGSYALRVYSPSPEGGARDRFVAGAIRPRDGALESIRFADLDLDGTPELVVVLRSAGSGGYLSADAFRLRGGVPRHAASVESLPADDEPLRALAAKLRPRGR